MQVKYHILILLNYFLQPSMGLFQSSVIDLICQYLSFLWPQQLEYCPHYLPQLFSDTMTSATYG